MDDEYELMPHSVLGKLKDDLDNLKKKASDGSGDVKESMEKLSNSINTMIELFHTATEYMQHEEKEQKLLTDKIDPVMEKLLKIEEQNEQIAEGLLSIADLIKDKQEEKPKKPEIGRPSLHADNDLGGFGSDVGKPSIASDFDKPLGMPPIPPPGPSMPPPMPPENPGMPPPMPPPPPSPPKKKGLMGLFSK